MIQQPNKGIRNMSLRDSEKEEYIKRIVVMLRKMSDRNLMKEYCRLQRELR